jgi:methanogenic corrinoid protein MtbC1
MNPSDASALLVAAISDLQEDQAIALVRRRIETGDDPLLIIQDCKEGMRQVGAHYERNEYFLAGLIMAGEIFREVMELLQPVVAPRASVRTVGRVLLGTVEGDIHDLGKNIVNMLLGCRSFAVYDLGVNVPPAVFADQVDELQPDIVGMSGLLTSSYDAMRETVDLLRSRGLQAPIIIGGGQISDEVCRFVGADHWTTDAVAGVEICQRLMSGETLPEGA